MLLYHILKLHFKHVSLYSSQVFHGQNSHLENHFHMKNTGKWRLTAMDLGHLLVTFLECTKLLFQHFDDLAVSSQLTIKHSMANHRTFYG